MLRDRQHVGLDHTIVRVTVFFLIHLTLIFVTFFIDKYFIELTVLFCS